MDLLSLPSNIFVFDLDWENKQKNRILIRLNEAENQLSKRHESIRHMMSHIAPIGMVSKATSNVNTAEREDDPDEDSSSDTSTQAEVVEYGDLSTD